MSFITVLSIAAVMGRPSRRRFLCDKKCRVCRSNKRKTAFVLSVILLANLSRFCSFTVLIFLYGIIRSVQLIIKPAIISICVLLLVLITGLHSFTKQWYILLLQGLPFITAPSVTAILHRKHAFSRFPATVPMLRRAIKEMPVFIQLSRKARIHN